MARGAISCGFIDRSGVLQASAWTLPTVSISDTPQTVSRHIWVSSLSCGLLHMHVALLKVLHAESGIFEMMHCCWVLSRQQRDLVRI